MEFLIALSAEVVLRITGVKGGLVPYSLPSKVLKLRRTLINQCLYSLPLSCTCGVQHADMGVHLSKKKEDNMGHVTQMVTSCNFSL